MRTLPFFFIATLLIAITKCEVSKRAKKIAARLLQLKKFHDSLKLRKLANTDEIEPAPVIPANKNTKASIQFLDINGYQKVNSPKNGFKGFKFNAFLYFLNMAIPKKVFVPLKLKLGRLRTLEQASVESTCTPSGVATQSDTAGGQSQKFECTGDVETDNEITGLSISADEGVQSQGSDGKNTTVASKDINFSEDAAKVATKIEEANSNVNKVLILQNGVVGSQNKGKFSIDGNLVEVEDGKTILLNLHDDLSNSDKEIPCLVKREGSNNAVVLNCDTNGEDLNADLNFKSGMEGTTKVFLNMTDENAKIEINDANSTTGNHYTYRKNSSGLSGGAIAGIVIACVVVLIAASLAAILLRKPTVTPPTDSTTVVQLRTVENS